MSRRVRLKGVPVAVVGLALVLVIGQAVGIGGRTYLVEQQVFTVDSAPEAYRTLVEAGVSGRRLILLDSKSRIVQRTWMATFFESLSDDEIAPPVMSHNLVSSLVYAGIVREVYFAPPQQAWPTEYERAAGRPDALAEGSGVRLRFYGAPVHVVRPTDIPLSHEKAIVLIAESELGGFDPDVIERVTSSDFADVVIWQR